MCIRDRKWNVRELECLAVVWACNLFRSYVNTGIPFTIETDHAALMSLQKATADRLVRWSISLSEYNLVIQHRKGKQNANADALSRLATDEASTFETNRIEDWIMNIKTLESNGTVSLEASDGSSEINIINTALNSLDLIPKRGHGTA